VNWATANGTANAPGDYLANSGTLTFVAGQTTGTINVAVNGDTIDEPDETFFVNLSNAVNGFIGDGQGVAGAVDLPDSTSALTVTVRDIFGNACLTNTAAITAARPFAAQFPYLSYVYQLSNSNTSSYNGLQAALTGTKTAEQAMKDAQREAERLLRPYK
jgi:hypothetical protein